MFGKDVQHNSNGDKRERRIRYYENQAAVYKGVDDKYAAECNRNAQKAYKAYVKYSKDNNVAYYPSRTAVYETEKALTEVRYRDKIELRKEFVEAKESGKIKPEINAEKQDRHYPDTSRYIEGKSRFTADRAEVEAYIEDRLGKVPIKRGRGSTIREIVVFDKPIGEYKKGDEWRETNVVEVHHSKTGRHSVPSRPLWDK